MAGKDIYLGKMMESLDGKINSLMDAMDSQSLKMDDQIAAINAQISTLTLISKNTGQTITQLNLKPGTVKEVNLNPSGIKSTKSTTFVQVIKIVSNATGSLTIEGYIRSQSTNGTWIAYSVDNGATWNAISDTTGTTPKLFTFNLPLIKGDVLIGIRTSNASWEAILNENCKLKYDVISMLEGSPFSVI